jgi:hypothetical protein
MLQSIVVMALLLTAPLAQAQVKTVVFQNPEDCGRYQGSWSEEGRVADMGTGDDFKAVCKLANKVATCTTTVGTTTLKSTGTYTTKTGKAGRYLHVETVVNNNKKALVEVFCSADGKECAGWRVHTVDDKSGMMCRG